MKEIYEIRQGKEPINVNHQGEAEMNPDNRIISNNVFAAQQCINFEELPTQTPKPHQSSSSIFKIEQRFRFDPKESWRHHTSVLFIWLNMTSALENTIFLLAFCKNLAQRSPLFAVCFDPATPAKSIPAAWQSGAENTARHWEAKCSTRSLGQPQDPFIPAAVTSLSKWETRWLLCFGSQSLCIKKQLSIVRCFWGVTVTVKN